MQITTGTCSVTNGSATVIASDGNDWSDASVGDLFFVTGVEGVNYFIGAVTPPETSGSGFWELSLTAPYAGTTAAGVEYAISIHFTTVLGLPIPQAGDRRTDLLVARALAILDTTPGPQGVQGEPGEQGAQGVQGEPGESPPPPPSIGIEGGSALLVWHGDAIAGTVLATYRVAKDCQLTRWQINAQDAPTGDDIEISGTKNSSPFADLVALPDGDRYAEAAMSSPLTLAEGDVLVFTFDQAGSTTPGQNLMIHLQLEPL